MVVLDCESVGLVLCPSDKVHGDELDDEADGEVKLHEEEEVEEVRGVSEAERLDDSFVV